MKYKLYIKNDGTWSLLDFGDDMPAFNFQSNNLVGLDSRQSNYSQQLRLPMTTNNKHAFGLCNIFDVVTDFAYQNHECRLYSNEYEIAGRGTVLILDRITDFFEVQIISGINTFFDAINRPMSEVDLGSIIRNQAATNPANFTDYYKFAAATFIKGGAPIYQTDLQHNYPFVNFKKVVETIITDKGYTLSTNLTPSEWNDMYLSLCSDVSNFDEYYGAAEKTGSYPNTGGSPINRAIAFDITENASGKLIGSSSNIQYYVPFEYSMVLNIDLQTTNAVQTTLSVQILESGYSTTIYNMNAPTHKLSLDLKLLPTQTINISCSLNIAVATTATIDSQITFTMQPQNVPFNEKLPFNINLGFTSQADVIKVFSQLFALTFQVDYATKTVYAYTMQKIIDNKINTQDWSGKLDTARPPEIVHLLSSYAQENIIKFIDNEADNVTSQFTFPSENEQLPKEKILFTLPFEAGRDGYVSGDYVANIPIEQITDTDIIMQGGKPHLVRITGSTITFAIGSTSYNYQKTKHIEVSEIEGYYTTLAKMLRKPKMIEVYFLLSDLDISRIDQFTPIYIDKFGAYFYLNKVINYISGQLTKCQLIKL